MQKKAQVTTTGEAIGIVTPAQRSVGALILISLWLTAWTASEIFSIWLALTGEIEPVTSWWVWIGFWTALGVFSVSSFLQLINAREIVTVNAENIVIARKGVNRHTTRTYASSAIRNLRVRQYGEAAGQTVFTSGSGPLAFDYENMTITFAEGLGQEEARQVLNQILKLKVPAHSPRNVQES